MSWKKPTFDKRQWAWHLGAVVLFYVLSNLLYSMFHEGYMLNQPDIMQYKGMSRELASHQILSGESAEWSNSMFGGMPTYQSGGGEGGFNWAKSVHYFLSSKVFKASEITITFIGMLAAYLLALSLRVAPWWAVTAGVGFGLSTVGVLYFGAGHRSKMHAVALMPGIVAGVLYAYRGRLWTGLALVTMFTTMHLTANHLQMTYYLLILLGLVAVALGLRSAKEGVLKGFLRTSVWLALAGGVAALPNILNILNTQEYSKFTTRGKPVLDYDEDGGLRLSDGTVVTGADLGLSRSGENSGEGLGAQYILEYSMSRMEWLAVMCPNFKGGAERVFTNYQGQRVEVPVYWGEQKYSAGAFYFGALIMVFFFAFLFVGGHWLRWPFLVMTALAVVLSWKEETWVMRFFLDHVPLFNKFRDTKMMLVAVQVMAGTGAVLLLTQLAEWGAERRSGKANPEVVRGRNRKVLGAIGAMLGVFVLFYALPTTFLSFDPELREDPLKGALGDAVVRNMRLEVFRADVLRTMGLIALAAGAAWALLSGKVQAKYVAVAVLLVQTVDLWTVNFRYHSNEVAPGQRSSWIPAADYMFPFRPNESQAKILRAEWKDSPELQGSQAKLLEAFIEQYPRRVRPADREFLSELADFQALRAEGAPFRVLHFDNPYSDALTSYFFQSVGGYHGAKLQRYQDFMEVVLAGELTGLSRAAGRDSLEWGLQNMWGHRMLNTKYIIVSEDGVIPFPNPAGPAWFVQGVKWVETSNDEALSTRALKGLETAVVPRSQEANVPFHGNPGEHRIDLIQHDPEYIAYDVSSENGGLMVCSEVYYPRGWKAYIDGERAPLSRANFVFRAISVPPGAHRVEMRFENESTLKSALAFGGGVFSLVFLLFSAVWSFREKEEEQR